ncbi:MAG: UDP-N-acetylmuramoyl-tripeptide--D-alanyl-D-alanine ligase [Syntrophales bacterium]
MNDAAPALSAAEILKATGGIPLRGGGSWGCRGISTDTRTLNPGNLFIALPGENFDGHDHLAAAARRGAAGLLIRAERFAAASSQAGDLPIIGVADTVEALGAIARAWRLRFPIPVVAITGSSGKTTTKELLAAIVSRSRSVLKTAGNLNNLIGLPLTLLGLRPGHETAIVELGTNRPGEIGRLAAIAEPDVGLITNIGPAHMEGLGSLEGIREEKGDLLRVMAGRGTAVINRDDDAVAVLAQRWQGNRVTFGTGPDADLSARRIGRPAPDGVEFELVAGGGATPVRLAVPGRHNVMNALAAAAAAWALGFDRQAIAAGLAAFHPVPGRMEIRALGTGARIVIDAYNANPASVREALLTLREVRGAGRGFAVLGDMLELGERAAELHGEVGALLAETSVERAYLKGPLSRFTAEGAQERGFPAERIVRFDDPGPVVADLRRHLGPGDWILIKGSRRMKMEAVAEAIIAAFDLKAQRV